MTLNWKPFENVNLSDGPNPESKDQVLISLQSRRTVLNITVGENVCKKLKWFVGDKVFFAEGPGKILGMQRNVNGRTLSVSSGSKGRDFKGKYRTSSVRIPVKHLPLPLSLLIDQSEQQRRIVSPRIMDDALVLSRDMS